MLVLPVSERLRDSESLGTYAFSSPFTDSCTAVISLTKHTLSVNYSSGIIV